MNRASCELIRSQRVNGGLFLLEFAWTGPAPKAGQFFMARPKRSGVFLGRPICAENWSALSDRTVVDGHGNESRLTDLEGMVRFLVAVRGKGTLELAGMGARSGDRPGEEAELIGPLGNAWADFLPPAEKSGGRPVALIGGGAGLAPLNALLREAPGHAFDLYAGFRTGPGSMEERDALLGAAYGGAKNTVAATEDGTFGNKGRIPDFLEPEKYAAVCACGPEPMVKAVAQKCAAAGVPCFVSLERRMACGVGACLGCTVKTADGNRRCCADGPIFDASEVVFDDQNG